MLLSLLNLFSITNVLIPNSNSFWECGNTYNIEWNNKGPVHIELEMNINNQWVSHIENDPHNFLSVMLDVHSYEYSWTVPIHFGLYWQNDKRIKITNLLSKRVYFSDNFTTSGLTINNIKNYYKTNDELIFSWETNNPSTCYNVILLNGSTDFYTFDPVAISNENNTYLKLSFSCLFNSFSTLIPPVEENYYKILVINSNNSTWSLSNKTYFDYYTFSPTSSPTLSPSGSPTLSPTTLSPSQSPTTLSPSPSPTLTPSSLSPTISPTESPSESPTLTPSTFSPTVSPTKSCVESNCNDESKNLDITKIIYITVPSAVILILLVFFLYKCCHKKRQNGNKTYSEPMVVENITNEINDEESSQSSISSKQTEECNFTSVIEEFNLYHMNTNNTDMEVKSITSIDDIYDN